MIALRQKIRDIVYFLTKEEVSNRIDELPCELILHIFSFLSRRDLETCSLVSKKWLVLASDNSLWRQFFIFPSQLPQKLSPFDAYYACKLKGNAFDHRRVSGQVACFTVAQGVGYSAIQNNIKIWDIDSGNEIANLQGHTKYVCCLIVEGDKLYSGSADTTIRIWNSADRKSITALQGHTSTVSCLATASGNLCSGSYDCSLRIWDKEIFQCLHVIEGHTSSILSIKIVEGKIYSTELDGICRIWDSKTATYLASIDTLYPNNRHSLCVEKNIYTFGGNYTIEVRDKTTYNRTAVLRYPYKILCFIVANDKIYTGSPEGIIYIQDCKNYKLLKAKKIGGPVLGIALIEGKIFIQTSLFHEGVEEIIILDARSYDFLGMVRFATGGSRNFLIKDNKIYATCCSGFKGIEIAEVKRL